MKQCPNCNGPLDDKGKCMVCGTTTRIDLSNEDGLILNKLPDDVIKAISQMREDKDYENN